jgi:hypothetical protein
MARSTPPAQAWCIALAIGGYWGLALVGKPRVAYLSGPGFTQDESSAGSCASCRGACGNSSSSRRIRLSQPVKPMSRPAPVVSRPTGWSSGPRSRWITISVIGLQSRPARFAVSGPSTSSAPVSDPSCRKLGPAEGMAGSRVMRILFWLSGP